MSEPNWRLGALATTAGIAVFAWGLSVGAGSTTLTTRVLAWPRSSESVGASYAVQVVSVGDTVEPQAHRQLECGWEPLETDESGYVLFSEPGALPARRCGPVTIDAAPLPPVGQESWSLPVQARVTPVTLHGTTPELYFEQSELTVDTQMLAFLALSANRAQAFAAEGEPGLEARRLAQCDDGVVLGLRASYHVTALHLEWGARDARERVDVATPVSKGGPRVVLSKDRDQMQFAQIEPFGDARGWLALFGAHGLVASVTAPDEPWPLPRLGAPAVLVGARGSFFDSVRSLARVTPPGSDPDVCALGRALQNPWPAPQPAVVLVDGVERAQTTRRMQNARGRRTAGFGLAGGLVGLAGALFGARSAKVTARALSAFAITLVLFGILAMLLYAA